MRKFITGILLTLALAIGGSFLYAAPAQAVWGSDVHYYAKGAAVPDSNYITVTRMDGAQFSLYIGDFMINAWRVCPRVGYRMVVTGPSGTTNTLDANQCYFPTKATPDSHYDFKVLQA